MKFPSAYDWSEDAPSTAELLTTPILSLISDLHPSSIIDVGCGNGFLLSQLFANGYTNLYGLEPDIQGYKISSKRVPQAKIYNVSCDEYLENPSSNTKYDVIISSEVIEHMYDPAALFRFSALFLNPGGILIITTPYHRYLKNLVLSLFGLWDKHLTANWLGGHIKFFSRASLSEMASDVHFLLTNFVGYGRAPYLWKSMICTFQALDFSND